MLSDALRTARSGMSVERFRMNVTSLNIANSNSVRTARGTAGEPARRQDVIIQGGPDGVSVLNVRPDMRPFRKQIIPGHPMADPQTNEVEFSNIEPVQEMVDMISASRAYEANVAAFNTAKSMMRKALEIGRV